ncbi:MAG: anti-sigma factor [Candidatus Eisenbacteria bacterium]|nr:anti-sigma factor [Candidatus Eisenbacteria bacterium]
MTASRPHDHYEELAAAHVLGVLAEPERSEFLNHLESGCPICRVVYPQLTDVAHLLVLGTDSMVLPPGLKARIMAAAAASAPPKVEGVSARRTVAPHDPPIRLVTRSSGRERLFAGLALAASLAFLVLGIRSMSWRQERDHARLSAEVNQTELLRLQNEIQGLELARAEQASLIDLLQNPGSGLVTLASLEPAPGASGKVLFDRNLGKGYLWVSNLPVDTEGKDYQLWAIQGGAPVSAGVFSVSANGSAVIPLDNVTPDTPVAAFAITLEPAGGLSAPSGPMVLLGTPGS